jgi:glycosyltransferase involved in cell wall biosynthesis
VNVLVVNFEMDQGGPVLAWQARVVQELAAHVDHVTVLSERVGQFTVPSNVAVVPIPRFMVGPARKLGTGWLLNFKVWRLCSSRAIDVCFVHMAHEWTYRLAPALRARGVPVLVWYAHGSTSRRLRITERLAARIITSTPEGFRLPSDKVHAIGQGVDTDLFSLIDRPLDGDAIVYVGRIAPRKQVHLLVEAMAILRDRRHVPPIRLVMIGPSITADDQTYRVALSSRIADLDLTSHVALLDAMAQQDTVSAYEHAFLHVNVSDTGSMDKTVLEALACGCPVLTSNPSFRELLYPHPAFLLGNPTPDAIASRIEKAYATRGLIDRAAIRRMVVGHHDLSTYSDRVVAQLASLVK